MMKKLLGLLIAVVIIAGCRKPPAVERIDAIGSVAMGGRFFPRNGEGELCRSADKLKIGCFSNLMVEAVPFEHRVFRMVMYAENVPGEGDVLAGCKQAVEEHFRIIFSTVDENTLRAELPGTIVTLRRNFSMGPRAAEVEFIDRKLFTEAEKMKRSPRYAESRLFRAAGENAALICRGIDEFIMDMGVAPERLSELLTNERKSEKWRGPYYTGTFPPGSSYQKNAEGKYEFFIVVNGKRINEDILL